MIPERQTGGLRKPHTAGGSARPRGPRGRAVAWGTATAGPWPVPGRHAPADESPPCCPRGGKREWSGRPLTSLRAPVPKPPGDGGPPAAPPHSAGPSGASPARPPTGLQPPQVACVSRRCDPGAQSDARGCSVLTTETSDPAAAPAATRTRRRAGAGDVAPCGEGARPPAPTRFQKAAYPHTRLRGSARAREPRPAPSDHRTRRLLSTGRAAEPRGVPGGSRHRGRGRRSPGPLFDRGSKSFKNVTRPMALKRRDAKPSGTVPRQQSHEDTPGRFLWSRARGPGPCGGCGVAHTPQGHGDSGLTGCPRERGRRPALHTMPRDGPKEPSALKARSWRSTPRRPRPRGPRAAVGLTLRTGDAPEDPAAAVLLPGRNTRGRTRPGPGLWLSPRAGPSDHPTTTPARKPRRSCRV